MRRADRLFQIVQYLRGGRLTTAAKLAERLEVSERTIYRDITDLQTNGVPIDGAAGVGYIMREGFDLPPLMFSPEEVQALSMGALMAQAFGGAKMALAAQEALVKIQAVLPEKLHNTSNKLPIHSFNNLIDTETRNRLDVLNKAIEEKSVLKCHYCDLTGKFSERKIEALALHYWGNCWTLVAWCQLRSDYRSFRVDRFDHIEPTQDIFMLSPAKSHRHFLNKMAKEESHCQWMN